MDAAFAWTKIRSLVDREIRDLEASIQKDDKKASLATLRRVRDELEQIKNYLV